MSRKLRYFTYILVAVNALVFSGCNLINPPEDIPAYIHIDKYTFSANEPKEGTASNKIEDAWVYVGNSFIGGFELPATIPVLEKGKKQAIIRAGVKENGIAATRLPYPFYENYTVDLDLIDAKIDTVKPVWKYKEDTHFPWLENFEGTSVSVELTNRSATDFRITNTPDSAFEGSSALKASVDASHTIFECQTKNTYQLPRGKAVWVEMNYKTDMPIEVGLISFGAAGNGKLFSAGINPSAHWNKIYLNLSSTVSYEPATQVFKIYIAAFNKDAGGSILIDNLKLLYLE